MQTPRTVISTAVVAVALGLASPALAQHHRGGGEGGHGSDRGSQSRGQAMPRAAQPPAARPAPAPAPAHAPRADNGGRRDSAPRAYPSIRGGVNRNESYRADAYRGNAYRNGGNRYDGYRSYSSHGYAYRPPVRFYRPYYAFRPRVSLGFGLWVGYPVPYAYSYYDPFYYGSSYPYPYPDSYPTTVYPTNPYPAYPPATNYPQSSPVYPQTAPNPNSIGVQPGQANVGGLSFEITPGDAEVVVDGNFVGTVNQFSPSSQPLGLSSGRHHVEVDAPGYQRMSFDVNIVAGQVLPYQGAMEAERR